MFSQFGYPVGVGSVSFSAACFGYSERDQEAVWGNGESSDSDPRCTLTFLLYKLTLSLTRNPKTITGIFVLSLRQRE